MKVIMFITIFLLSSVGFSKTTKTTVTKAIIAGYVVNESDTFLINNLKLRPDDVVFGYKGQPVASNDFIKELKASDSLSLSDLSVVRFDEKSNSFEYLK